MPGTATVRKQPNSRMCFVCGTRNFAGLKVRFYEQADGGVLARFAATALHADDAGDLSLAAIAAAMDEAMGRAIMIPYGEAIWGVTAELSFQIHRAGPGGRRAGRRRPHHQREVAPLRGARRAAAARRDGRGERATAATSSSIWSRSAASIPSARSGASGPTKIKRKNR